jgi:predicted nuclease of predicted toxin-antitoxin system
VAAALLFDQNLAPRLAQDLADLFPGSVHVRTLGLESARDEVIWQYAKERNLTIVTKDDDFRQRAFLRGHPPKVIWLRLGNCRTEEIATELRKRRVEIERFLRDPMAALLVLNRQS